MRTLVTLKGETGLTRTETYLGREWTVVPVVALVEGVIHAMNSKHPEYVSAQVFSRAPMMWNGRPVFVGHPMKGADPVPGNTPETLEALGAGLVFNAGVKNNKLAMEAWIDNARADVVPDLSALLERVAAGEPIEISVGAFVDTNDASGEYNGKEYQGEWIEIFPEHLALLPEGDIGACSREMGCGVRAAKGATMDAPKKSFLARVMSALRVAQEPDEMSDNDVRRKLYDALKEAGTRETYVEAVFDAEFVYCVYAYDTYATAKYFRRGFTVDANGAVTLSGEPVEVEPVLKYESVAGEEEAPAPTVASSCGCKRTPQPTTLSQEKPNMKKEDILAKLEGATEEQLANIGKVFEPAPAVDTPAPAVDVPTVAKAPTFNDLLSAADPDVRESINTGIRVARERKAATIKSLKDTGKCTFSDEQLQGMTQAQLDSMVTLAGVPAASVDFSAAGLPRVPETPAGDVPAAPSLVDAIRAKK